MSDAIITKLVVASHNAGKVREIRDLLAPFGVETVSAADLNLPEPEETEDSYVGNAVLKARAAADASGLLSLADDSGMAVTALDGQPGIHSARWAGEPRDFGRAMARVEEELSRAAPGPSGDRSAAFICVLALAEPRGADGSGGDVETYEGRVEGQLVFPPRGDQGFGYDPIFIADGDSITFGEMDPVKKHAMSHRAVAFAKFVAARFST